MIVFSLQLKGNYSSLQYVVINQIWHDTISKVVQKKKKGVILTNYRRMRYTLQYRMITIVCLLWTIQRLTF